MATDPFQAFIDAINSGQTPEQIQAYANAVASGQVPSDVAANPSNFGYDYVNDPAGLNAQRQQAFNPGANYDYRTNPSYLALTRGFDYQDAQVANDVAHQLGNLDVLQPITEADIMAQRDTALRGVNLNAEARGIYQSGERLQNQARTTGDYARQLSGVQLSGGIQRGNIQYDAARQLADLANRRAEAITSFTTPPLPSAPSSAFG